MKILTVKAPAKINWFLKVGDLLPNGYHEISTLMQTVDLCDELTFEETGQQPAYFMDDCPAGPENLIVRAAEAFYSKLGRRPWRWKRASRPRRGWAAAVPTQPLFYAG